MKLPQGWKRPFGDPIVLPDGRKLVTLEDAATYVQKLPPAEQQLQEWQAAVEAMLVVFEHTGPTMFSRIAVVAACQRWNSEKGEMFTFPHKRRIDGMGSRTVEFVAGTHQLVDISMLDGQGRLL
jgi:hypothetical protein